MTFCNVVRPLSMSIDLSKQRHFSHFFFALDRKFDMMSSNLVLEGGGGGGEGGEWVEGRYLNPKFQTMSSKFRKKKKTL